MGKKEEQYTKRRLRMAYVTSVFSVTLVLFVLGVLGSILIGGKKLAEYVKENLKMQVFLNQGVDEEKAEEIKSYLEENVFVSGVVLITPEEALEEYRQKMDEDPMEMLDDNPLPTTLEISFKPKFANNESIAELEGMLFADYPEEVSDISRDNILIDQVNANISKISMILLGISLLLSLIMIALINNTIRLQVFSKRFLIKTMQLVGATGKFIRMPFVKSGVLQGLMAGMISSIFLGLIIIWISRKQTGLLNNEDYMLIGGMMIGIIFIGMLISYVSTRIAVQKFLRLKMDELY